MVLVFREHKINDAACGRGNASLKCVRNLQSVGCLVDKHDVPSAMVLRWPGMWYVVVSGKAWHASIWIARACSRCAAVFALDDSNHDAQATVGVLSQPIAMWLCCRSTRHSRTSHGPNSPAISRSKLVMVPAGLILEQMFSWVEAGKVIHQTMAGSCFLPPIHMPPAPCLDASQYPM